MADERQPVIHSFTKNRLFIPGTCRFVANLQALSIHGFGGFIHDIDKRFGVRTAKCPSRIAENVQDLSSPFIIRIVLNHDQTAGGEIGSDAPDETA